MPGNLDPQYHREPGSKWPGFLVNRSGLPIDDQTWTQIWEFAAHLYPGSRQEMQEISQAEDLPEIPHATPPPIYLTKGGGTAKIPEYIEKIQNYLNKLTYNHTGTQLFDIKPHSSMITLMETAKAMVRESLPIKCMEAVVLAIYLTNGIPGLGRFPINFKSEVNEVSLLKGRKFYYHVVLGVAYKGKFGAIGLSRRNSLMYKSLDYNSLHTLVQDYNQAYTNCGHKLMKVRIGELVTHDAYSISPISWRGLTLRPLEDDESEAKKEIEKFSNQLKSFLRYEKPI